MTKKDLITFCKAQYSQKMTKALYGFFESNVCIPKGETLQAKIGGNWVDVLTHDEDFEYRIKPSEPVVKYKYAYVDYDGNVTISDYVTEEYAQRCILNRTKATRLDWSIKND